MYKIKLITVFSLILIAFQTVFCANFAQGKNAYVLNGSITMTDRVPGGFYGSWKVFSVRTKTTDPQEFGQYGVDIWNLSKSGDVITLSNPVSGAQASILVNDVNGNTVKFRKISRDIDEESIETPTLTLQDDFFYGVDKIVVKSYKNGNLIKEDNVEYRVRAVKVKGIDVQDLLGK